MLYRDALELARNNPGCLVTRASDGEFVVKRPDGSILDSVPAPTAPTPTMIAESEDHEHRIERLVREVEYLQQRYDATLFTLDEERRQAQERLSTKDQLMGNLRGQLKDAETRIASLTDELNNFKARMAKLSPEEQERLKALEADERKNHSDELRNERHTRHCSCQGEVENCVRCNGRGSYITDGYGNIVAD